ncbi:hypothetical protein AVEN_128467-1 [Araneus ventricosus]|uniref:Uncharacterized protein n=1 Tax=Araneus ventricosus TaxID=182803 RepID=A0A4Y2RPA6_ARAVE|nr:hypothetical protein AVEN_128467-1 [Araneus ventricosus]
MSVFAGARKRDLKILAEELGEKVDDSHKLKDMKKMILSSKEYDEECAKEWLDAIINEREEIAERKSQEEIAERKSQEEIAERKHREEIQMEERRRREEYEERKRKDEMEYELQKIGLGAQGRFSNSVANQNINSTQMKPKLELNNLMQKFNSD